MSKVLQRLNVLAICLLGGVLATVVLAQIRPGPRPSTRVDELMEKDWTWPKTLQVHPADDGDPVELVRILIDGQEAVPGAYIMPAIAGDNSHVMDAVQQWSKRVSFALKSQTTKNIVSVGISIVVPVRRTDLECWQITGSKSVDEPMCKAHPHWCDGGCPTLIQNTMHWGRIPANAASGLEARYAIARAEGKHWRNLLEGSESLRIAPGEEVTLSPAERGEGIWGDTAPWLFSIQLDGILFAEGIEEARGAEPCFNRSGTKKGCAFAEVSKFNVAVDIVYFEDGTIWGNYGYGYALPNPDGIFTRVDARDFPGLVNPPPGLK
jgi:hypothetical protein